MTMRLVRFALLVLLTLLAPPAYAQAPADAQESGASGPRSSPEMTFAGVEQFWRTTALLQGGQSPTEAQWNRLFTAPGYRLYFVDQNRDRRSFKALMRLVFMPANDAALRDTLERVRGQLRPDLRPLHVLVAAKRNRAALTQFRRGLQDEDLFRQAAREAATLLPDGALADSTGQLAPPPVRFNIYNLDGRGRSDGIVVDLVMMHLLGRKGARLFLAHEMHHAGRRSRLNLPERDADPRHALLQAVDQLQAEGIADLIDKPHLHSEEGVGGPRPDDLRSAVGERWAHNVFWAFTQQMQEAFAATPRTLQRVDSLLVAAARADAAGNDPALQRHSEAIYRSLPNNGHPNGHYMATLIAEHIGRDALAQTVHNPFAFVRLYNQAARQRPGPPRPLSADAMAYLDRLERQYAE